MSRLLLTNPPFPGPALSRSIFEKMLMHLFTFANSQNDADGRHIVHFTYKHEGRKQVDIFVDVQAMEVKYEGFSGLTHDWHGLVSERNHHGSYVGPPCHEIMFFKFRSFHGICTNLLFRQRGQFTWSAMHPRDRVPIVIVRVPPAALAHFAPPAALTPPVLPMTNAEVLGRWRQWRSSSST